MPITPAFASWVAETVMRVSRRGPYHLGREDHKLAFVQDVISRHPRAPKMMLTAAIKTWEQHARIYRRYA